MPEGITPLRLGWGSHFMATTLLLAFRNDEILRYTMESLIRVFELDLTSQQKRLIRDLEARRINLDEFPRSRRLASMGYRPAIPVAPLGWIALRLPGAPPAPKLVDMDALMAQRMATDATPPHRMQREQQRTKVLSANLSLTLCKEALILRP